jgi:hypothetical protein
VVDAQRRREFRPGHRRHHHVGDQQVRVRPGGDLTDRRQGAGGDRDHLLTRRRRGPADRRGAARNKVARFCVTA